MLRISRTPRVLQVVLSLNPGGTERLVIEIVRRLNAEIPMAVCCLDDAGAWAPEVKSHGVEVTALNRKSGFRPAIGMQVARAARAHRAGVLHCHHYSPFVYGCIARLCRPNLRVLFTEHGRLSDSAPSAKRRMANRLLARVPDGVFAVSNELARHIVEEGFPQHSVRTIYNGIALGPSIAADTREELRSQLSVGADTLVVGTIARLDAVKDLTTVIEAMRTIAAARPALLLIIGDGPERANLQGAAASLSAAVRFLGHQEDARRWLPACDIYVNCSISEGVSLTILEGMAAGLPVVATRVGGTPEVIGETCGRLVQPRSPSAIADSIMDLARRPEERQALGEAGRQRVHDVFSIDRMVREYRELYERV